MTPPYYLADAVPHRVSHFYLTKYLKTAGMDQQVQTTAKNLEQWTIIENVKIWIDDIYQNKLYYSFSLHSLELTRRFMQYYTTCRKEREMDPLTFDQLYLLAENLEKRLAGEQNL